MLCEVCESIGDRKTITTKEFNADFERLATVDGSPPEQFPALENVTCSVRRCPGCGVHFQWSESSSSIQGGPEYFVYETLRRMEPDEARAAIEKERNS